MQYQNVSNIRYYMTNMYISCLYLINLLVTVMIPMAFVALNVCTRNVNYICDILACRLDSKFQKKTLKFISCVNMVTPEIFNFRLFLH